MEPYSPDYDRAREHAATLREIFRLQSDGSAQPELLARVSALCAASAAAVDDAHCRLRLELLKNQATLLFGGDQPWIRGVSVGPQALRLQALKLVSSFERWLDRAELQSLVATLPPAPRPRP